jgi:nucleoside-diphosphate-sugar epimerase
METVLLTGATGFLGSYLLEGLVRENYDVIILKRSFSDTWRIGHLLTKVKSYDIDNASLEDIFKENKIDIVIHTATLYGKKGEDNAAIIESNLLLPVRLLDLSIACGIKSFFNTDSFINSPNYRCKYLHQYCLSKRQLGEWLRADPKNVQIVNLKLEHLYGPRDSNNKFVIWLVKECIRNAPELSLTRGEQKRDFIYVSDAVNAFLAVLQKRGTLPDYAELEVGTGEVILLRDFAIKVKETVSAVSGREIGTSLNFGALPYAEGEIMESRADNAALRQLGWSCSVSLKDGLKKTIKEILDLRETKSGVPPEMRAQKK